MKKIPLIFSFKNNQVRTVQIDNDAWFVGKDVATILGYSQTAKAVRDHVDDDDKGVSVLDTPGGQQRMTLINESGVYSLVFGSNLPNAKEFKRWVTKEVLPEIRKTGSFNSPQSPEEMLALTMNVTNRTVKRVESIEKDVNDLKNNVVIDSGSYAAIGRLVSRRVYEFLDERRYQHNRENVSALFSDINHGIKQVTGVRTRSQIKSKDFEKVMKYIDAWEPATATKMELINKKVGA
ncbi:ORF6C domain-containing protein [Apilactobacillus kunkeei]|uniref:BRO family protein n=1 Tax=Apilactobacillus kunkeei TaxID=148814 RepID=UPI00200A9087|nr:BRO family protein [Apilactobacillus kunkeei]MCK8619682.1 ORF6C domain-containing protein [Apilactobacillus kunkeei]